MTPALAMPALQGKGRGAAAISNDLGPPIFMPCKLLMFGHTHTLLPRSQASLIFCCSSASVYYTECKSKNKNGRGLGMRLCTLYMPELRASSMHGIPHDVPNYLSN